MKPEHQQGIDSLKAAIEMVEWESAGGVGDPPSQAPMVLRLCHLAVMGWDIAPDKPQNPDDIPF